MLYEMDLSFQSNSYQNHLQQQQLNGSKTQSNRLSFCPILYYRCIVLVFRAKFIKTVTFQKYQTLFRILVNQRLNI